MPLAPDNDYTLLLLDGMGVPLYSARGLTQTLAPIAGAAQVRRTVNGGLIDLSYSQFQKYSSKISCTDHRTPAIDGIWPGMEVTVACVAELASGTSGALQRIPVSGSQRTEDGFTFYRPVLDMVVMGYETQTDEYGATVGWSLDLEEV